MKSITVFVMLDACRPDYINEKTTPFLHKLSLAGYCGIVKPTFGFEPDAAYLAGLYPDQADGGAQFWYAPDESPFQYAGFLPKFFNTIPELPQKVIRKLLVKLARSKSSSPNLSTARIPFHILNQFSLPVKYNLDHPRFNAFYFTVFDLLRAEKQQWLFHAAPEYRVKLKTACKRAENELAPPNSFAFFHIGDLDGTGHKFGPGSLEIQNELNKVDKGLELIFILAEKRFNNVHFVIMGDHGMAEVKNFLDIGSILQSLPLDEGKDYLCLLDSTMARFWFFSMKAEELIEKEMTQVMGGRLLQQKDKDKYHLNYEHNRFGDMIFLADPGNLIFPNHFQRNSPVKGMHGYAPETPDQQAVFIVHSPDISPKKDRTPRDMRRVFPTLCDLLSIDKPHFCSLKSLVTI